MLRIARRLETSCEFSSRFCFKFKTPIRTKFKKTWAEYRKKKTTSEHALAYFDTYHKQVYDKQWPSLRLGLLSAKKHGALLNNFAVDSDDVQASLEECGTMDIIEIARERHMALLMKNHERIERAEIKLDRIEAEELPPEPTLVDRENIHEFVPPKKIYTDDELYAMEQFDLSIYKSRNVNIPKIVDYELTLPNKLKMYCHDKDEVASFPSPKADDLGKLGYYLQDAASILPVIALDLRPGDHVLDLCAAPGGKSLAMIQTMLPEKVIANDNSESRIRRMLQVIQSYLPANCSNGGISISRRDGKIYQYETEFDKVLVDVPCLTDRHVLNTDENNIFKPARINERITLPQKQSLLLKSGLNNVKIDGNVVYSTCTLANAQNDGVVEMTLNELQETTDKRFVVVNISVLEQLFHDVFFFHKNSRHGILVLPNVRANFGPMYVCKIKRLA